MINLNSDVVLRRWQSIGCYVSTIFILFGVAGYGGLASLYGYFAISQLVADDLAEDIIDRDMYEEHAIQLQLSAFGEMDEDVLLDWNHEELLDSVIYDSRLPQSYALIESYYTLLNVKSLTKLENLLNLDKSVGLNNNLMQKKLLQSKLKLNEAMIKDKIKEKTAGITNLELVKFKSTLLIANSFIIDSYIATGIYSCRQYDFELYLANGIPLECYFYDYMLLANQNNNILKKLPDLIETPSNTNALIKLVNSRISPKHFKLQDFLEGDRNVEIETKYD